MKGLVKGKPENVWGFSLLDQATICAVFFSQPPLTHAAEGKSVEKLTTYQEKKSHLEGKGAGNLTRCETALGCLAGSV